MLDQERLKRPAAESPEWFRTLSDDPDRDFLIEHEDEFYFLWAYTHDPGPPLSAIAPRLLSFALATVLGAVGGYTYVNADG